MFLSVELKADENKSKEEPLPLNDPFVGDSSLTGGSKILSDNPEELENNMSLYKFKLVGVMTSENDKGFASLIDENGEVINPKYVANNIINIAKNITDQI